VIASRPVLSRTRRAAGFSLVEVVVASAIFLFIAMAAYSVFTDSNHVYRSGNESAELQQRTRLAFEVMLDELRLAGFDYNRDGEFNAYPDHPDEQLEYLSQYALTFRGNLDYGEDGTGREADLELPNTDPDFGVACCPIVTTGNDEIVTYALRSDRMAANTGTITFLADTSAPRDAFFDAGEVDEEEEITIQNVDLSSANPPYTLMRFTLDEDGEVVEQPVASDIRSLKFTYEAADGVAYWCSAPAADGTCSGGNQVAFATVGGQDSITGADNARRTARAAVRRVKVELIGMTEHDQPRYVDRNDTLMRGRRKLVLTGVVSPTNLGLKGSPDLEDIESNAPTDVTLCPGQCNTIRVEWTESRSAAGYNVMLYLPAAQDPFFTGATPGVQVVGNANRVYAVFQRSDAAPLVNGATVFATVQARFAGGDVSEDSEPSDNATLTDVARLEAPRSISATGYDTAATGWPDLTVAALQPDTLNASGNGAQANQIAVSWVAPAWSLDVTNPASPATTWTTRRDVGYPAVACDSEDADVNGDTQSDGSSTRARDMAATIRYLVFRSNTPRFVPTAAHFIGAVQGVVDATTGRVTYVDQSLHVFANGVFNSTTNALENCHTYYYRVRAVDDCWAGSSPASLTDTHISPFAPALNPSPTAANSDDTTGLSPSQVGLAIPGYAVPQAVPRKPVDVRFTRYDRFTDDGDGLDAVIGFDAAKLDNFVNPATSQPAYDDIAISEYRVYVNTGNPNFTAADMAAQANGTSLVQTITLNDVKAGRIAYDDENGNGVVTPNEDESNSPGNVPGVSPTSGLRVAFSGMASRFYKVVAVQCASEITYPNADPASFDLGIPSDAVKFPCDFGGGPWSYITVNSVNFPTSVTADAFVEVAATSAPTARLVLKDQVTGDRVMSPFPGVSTTVTGTYTRRVTFNAALIASLTNNFGNGSYRISVEWDDSNGCLGISDSANQTVALPACCLVSGPPVMTKVTTTQVRHDVRENCGVAQLSITSITLTVNNANGAAAEKFSTILWNGTNISSPNASTITIDRSANPLPMTGYQQFPLVMNFSRAVPGDTVTASYTYRVGGTNYTCNFSQLIP
jgi:prepilin-type N-terminal cleavage/methylation domain-containing protein